MHTKTELQNMANRFIIVLIVVFSSYFSTLISNVESSEQDMACYVYLDEDLILFGISNYETKRPVMQPNHYLPYSHFILNDNFQPRYLGENRNYLLIEGNIRLRMGLEFATLRKLVLKRDTNKRISLQYIDLQTQEKILIPEDKETWVIPREIDSFILDHVVFDNEHLASNDVKLALRNVFSTHDLDQELLLFSNEGVVASAVVPGMRRAEAKLGKDEILQILSTPLQLTPLGRKALEEIDDKLIFPRELLVSSPNFACYADDIRVILDYTNQKEAYQITQPDRERILNDSNTIWATHVNRPFYLKRLPINDSWGLIKKEQ